MTDSRPYHDYECTFDRDEEASELFPTQNMNYYHTEHS